MTWLPLRLTQQTLVQAASHASQPTSKPVTPPDRIETSPTARSARRSVLDIRV
ncbi:hypothetical protein [uncultured Caulobacter sp.]|uniref:hypothetical protein n=1 Tax=uncultured Caulobacter sp. TaxID=158749 RepID=UPI002619AB6C|nr:hypothetical protein [uncultured Caulobacter sp.]